METFKRSWGHTDKNLFDSGYKPEFRKIQAQRIEISGRSCFVYKEKEWLYAPAWSVVDCTTGLRAAQDADLNIAIMYAGFRFLAFPETLTKTENRLKQLKVKLPVNS